MHTEIQSKFNFFKSCGYTPHPKQAEIHQSTARFRAIAAGARSGKSMAAGAEIAFMLMFPKKRIWCVSSQYELADKEFDWALEFLSRIYVDGKRLTDAAKITSASRGSRKLEFPWGSFVKTKSTEKAQTLLGEELDMIVLGEASQVARAPWERMLRARLGPRNGRLIAASTPNSDAGLFRIFFENGLSQDPNFSDWASWQFATIDNPTFSREEYEIARKELDENVFKEQYEGLFVSRRGKVFNFQDCHIFREIPTGIEDWPIIRAIQRGYQNPFVCLFIAISPDREYYVIDEVFATQTLINDVSPIIIEKSKGKRILASIGDYRDQEGLEQLAKNGIKCTTNDERKYTKQIGTLRRVQAIQNCLKIRDTGTSKIHVFAGCENLIHELKECKWPDKQPEEREKAEIELPLTKFFQSPAALSYVVAFCEVSQGFDIYSFQGTQKNERN